MTKRHRRHIVPALAALVAFATALPANAEGGDVAVLDSTLSELVKAYESTNVARIMSYYVPTDALVVFDVTPPIQYTGFDVYRKMYEEFFAAFPGKLTVDAKDRKVRVVGDLAYAHELDTWSATDKAGQKTVFTCRETYVFQKIEGKWLIVHEHASVPVDLATGKAILGLKP